MDTNAQGITVSQILRSRTEIDDEPKKKSREDWRKAKELEEARKAGTAPAAVDEEGKDINPHIPQYISTAPWYYGSTGPTLKHQRPQPEKQKVFSEINDWYKRGVDTKKKEEGTRQLEAEQGLQEKIKLEEQFKKQIDSEKKSLNNLEDNLKQLTAAVKEKKRHTDNLYKEANERLNKAIEKKDFEEVSLASALLETARMARENENKANIKANELKQNIQTKRKLLLGNVIEKPFTKKLEH